MTTAIVGAIAPEIDQAEHLRSNRKPPGSLDAWNYIQQGLALYGSGDLVDLEQAISMFDAARKTDGNFVDAIAVAAHSRLRTAYHYTNDQANSCVRRKQFYATRLRVTAENCHYTPPFKFEFTVLFDQIYYRMIVLRRPFVCKKKIKAAKRNAEFYSLRDMDLVITTLIGSQ